MSQKMITMILIVAVGAALYWLYMKKKKDGTLAATKTPTTVAGTSLSNPLQVAV